MSPNNIQKAIKTTKEAKTILTKAGGIVVMSSFNTAKQIASLYKNAGLKTFDLSKTVVQKTIELTFENQKEILKTSGNAIKKATQSILEGSEPELKTMTSEGVKEIPK